MEFVSSFLIGLHWWRKETDVRYSTKTYCSALTRRPTGVRFFSAPTNMQRIVRIIMIIVLWDARSCSLVGVNRRFRKTRCVHHQNMEARTGSSETPLRYTSLDDVTTRKREIFLITVGSVSNIKTDSSLLCLFSFRKTKCAL